jgi:hypothetical protein
MPLRPKDITDPEWLGLIVPEEVSDVVTWLASNGAAALSGCQIAADRGQYGTLDANTRTPSPSDGARTRLRPDSLIHQNMVSITGWPSGTTTATQPARSNPGDLTRFRIGKTLVPSPLGNIRRL